MSVCRESAPSSPSQQIWVSAVKHYKRAATCFYPGSEAPILNVRPDIWIPYARASSMSTNERIDVVLSWLDLPPSDQPDIMLVYFSVVDSNGHGFGPNSKQVEVSCACLLASSIGQRFPSGSESRDGKVDGRDSCTQAGIHGQRYGGKTTVIYLARVDMTIGQRPWYGCDG